MRILFFNHNVAWSGGTFFRAYHLARMLTRRGHEVTLVSVSRRARWRCTETQRDGVTVVESPDLFFAAARTGWDPWDAVQRIRFCRRRRYDLVHAFDSRPAVIWPALAQQAAGVPLVVDWADWWGRGGIIEDRPAGSRLRMLVRPIETFFEEHYRTRADGTTVISAALRERAVRLGVAEDTIETLPGGCDVETIRPRSRAECRRRLGIAERTPLVGYLGALLTSDAALLFETFRRLATGRPDTHLVLIGNPRVPVPEERGILTTGFVPLEQLQDWLGACDVLLLPQNDTIANRGRWPSKINDYLAAGRPVVTTRVGDIAQMFEGEAIGAAVSPTPVALAAAVQSLLDDPARVEACGARARRMAEEELDWRRLATRLETFYERVTCRTRRAAVTMTAGAIS